MKRDWAKYPWQRCAARTEYYKRCELKRGHAGDHTLNHVLDFPQWSTKWTA